MIDNKTTNFAIPLPNAGNNLSDDVLRLVAGLTLVDTLLLARPTTTAVNAAISSAVASLVNSSPAALDTLSELAAALGNDANFATTVTNALAAKLDKSGGTMTGVITFASAQRVAAAIVTGLAAVATSGAYADLSGKPTLPSGAIVGTTDSQTVTNKRVTPRALTTGSNSIITPTGDNADQFILSGLAVAASIAVPSGIPTDGQRLMLRIKDDGTSRALTWTTSSGGYRAMSGVSLPAATTAGKWTYIGCIWNAADSFWDVVGVITQP